MIDDPVPELVQSVALGLIPGLGSKTLYRLLDAFGALDGIFEAPHDALLAVRGIGPKLAAAIRAADLDRTREDIIRWRAGGIQIARRDDPCFPRLLRELDDAPPVLFWRGDLRPDEARTVAIVGTRTPSAPARRTAEALAGALSACGCTIVSGLAAGIDTAAHRGALHAGTRTLAVLGSGVNRVYPPGNQALARQIVASGAVIAEVHPNAGPNAPALVARNRLISGLSDAVIVVEAGATSGSLHAARFAGAQGRAVYAVECAAAGTQHLIETGAAQPLPPTAGAWYALAERLAAGMF
ncbi:DNA-processing protein DprA [Aggregatilinea lenta]|uniref:DNA-processing protein DprA n=1 Tax=Aggregatilinea lenta TaxID=913108 RepID=UPI0013C32B75|nr:DNA-processing protein DprA [Aggregatilinea lenta]